MRHALMALGLLCAGVQVHASSGPARLIEDINKTMSPEIGSFPGDFHRLGSMTLFRAGTHATGAEVWRTDGTEAGTSLLKDVWPGPGNGSSEDILFDPALLGQEALFIASDGIHGSELWTSDGTEAGTRMVKDIRPGQQGTFDAQEAWTRVEAGELVYFIADDGVHGSEMWRTDGTEAGTVMLKDIRPGPAAAFLPGLALSSARVGHRFFFSAYDDVHGLELWKTNGTPEGTVLVKDILSGQASSSPVHMFDLDGLLVFWALSPTGAGNLWTSNGTEAGTALLRTTGSIPHSTRKVGGSILYAISATLHRTDGSLLGTQVIQAFRSLPEFLGELDGHVVLRVDDGIHGTELWESDATVAGTRLLKDIRPGSASSFPAGMVSTGERLFFLAYDDLHGTELWTSDGTEDGTHLVHDLTPGPTSTNTSLFEAGGLCYLSAYDGVSAVRFWRSDGTAAGTRPLKDLSTILYAGAAPDGSLLLAHDDGRHGIELWKTDGTDTGTALVRDINTIVMTNPSGVRFLGAVSSSGAGDRMFFRADDGVHGHELWASDGTPEGTRLVRDILPGPYGYVSATGLVHGGLLYFTADDGVHGRELWRSDGTEAGTYMVADVSPYFHLDSGLVSFGGEIYFLEDDGYGLEVWKSDGTAAGTVQVTDMADDNDSFHPDRLFATEWSLFFSAGTPRTLWKSDGTQAGTVPVSGGASFNVINYVDLDGKLFFTAFSSAHGHEPWISDGTEAGTHVIRDIRPGSASADPFLVTRVGASVFFAANDGLHGRELWKTDGTEAGTVLVKDKVPGPAGSGITSMAGLDGILYFHEFQPGTSLWRSDGTEEGTVPIKANPAGAPSGMQAVTGGLLFESWDGDHGWELWRSDGTSAGTVLAQDFAEGPRDSSVAAVAEMGSRTFIAADDGLTGTELWVARTAILMNQPARAVQDLRGEVAALALERGVKKSLFSKLDAAALAMAEDRTTDALTSLGEFGKHVNVLTPRWITERASGNLREFAGEIAGLLEEPAP